MLLTFEEAGKLLGGVKVVTVHAYVRRGVRIRGTSKVVKLRFVQLPRGRRIERSEIDRFLGELTRANGGRPAPLVEERKVLDDVPGRGAEYPPARKPGEKRKRRGPGEATGVHGAAPGR